MGLGILTVLQGVLHAAQEYIGFLQLVSGAFRHQACLNLSIQGSQQSTLLQGGHFSAANQLRELHHEFDLSNATIAQFDIALRVDAVASRGLALPVQANAFTQISQGSQGIEIKIFPVYKGHTHAFYVLYGEFAVAVGKRLSRHDATFKPCVALPFSALREKILLKSIQAPGQGAGVTIRPQSQIGAKHLSMLIEFGQHRHHLAGELAVELVVRNGSWALRLTLFCIQHDQINI